MGCSQQDIAITLNQQASPKDIEDLAMAGRLANTCPYFGSRRAIPQAEVGSRHIFFAENLRLYLTKDRYVAL